MGDMTHATLAGWANFYLITGTAAAALTGLQFIVQTLLASEAFRPIIEGDPEGGVGTFGSPTVVHFTLALIVSAVMCVPWPGFSGLRAALGVLGACALAYSVIILRRVRRQRSYVPVAEDWFWYILLPGAAYAALLLAAVLLGAGAAVPLFVVAAVTLLLIGIGIHNAWDTVTYITFRRLRASATDDEVTPR
jgi:hypothetical protein